MPFYFLAVRPWVHDMKKVACIEIAGSKGRNRNGKLQDLSDVRSVNDLMNKKAMPIRNVSIKYAKDIEKGAAKIFLKGGTITKEELLTSHRKNETLGETLQRVKEEKKARKAAFNQYKRTLTVGSNPSTTISTNTAINRRRRRSTGSTSSFENSSNSNGRYYLSDSISTSSNSAEKSNDPEYVRKQLLISTGTLGDTLKRIKQEKKARKAAMAHYKRTLATPKNMTITTTSIHTSADNDDPDNRRRIRQQASDDGNLPSPSSIYASSSFEDNSSSSDIIEDLHDDDQDLEIIHIPDHRDDDDDDDDDDDADNSTRTTKKSNLQQQQQYGEDEVDTPGAGWIPNNEDHTRVLPREEKKDMGKKAAAAAADLSRSDHDSSLPQSSPTTVIQQQQQQQQQQIAIPNQKTKKNRDPFECDVDELQEAMMVARRRKQQQQQQQQQEQDNQQLEEEEEQVDNINNKIHRHVSSNTDATAVTTDLTDSSSSHEPEEIQINQQKQLQQKQQPQHPTPSVAKSTRVKEEGGEEEEEEEPILQQQQRQDEEEEDASTSSFSSFFSNMESRVESNDTEFPSIENEQQQWQQFQLQQPAYLKSAMKVKTLQESLHSIISPIQQQTSGGNDTTPSRPKRADSDSEFDFDIDVDSDDDGDDDEEEVHVDEILRNSQKQQQQQQKPQQQPCYPPVKPTFGVEWGQIEIREYQICMGDNPACGQGVPIQLDWSYATTHLTFVEVYEHYKLNRFGTEARYPQRISSRRRQQMLLGMGYTPAQMKIAIQIKARDQHRRVKTVSRLKYMEFDSRVEKIVRIFPTGSTGGSTPTTAVGGGGQPAIAETTQ